MKIELPAGCWLLLALLFHDGARAAPEVSEARWVAAAESAVAFGRSQGLPIELQVQSGDQLSKGHTPIGIWSEDGKCTVVISVRDNPTAKRLTDQIDEDLVDLFLTGAAIHEVGHCYRRLNGYPHNEQLLPIVANIGPVRDWFNRRIRTEEAYADMYEVAWLARFHPGRFDAMVSQILRIRTYFREPKHDTLAWLEAARQEGPGDDGSDLFMLAGKRLARGN
jgi:hypothetical protein